MKAGFPFLTFAIAEVFHEFGRGIAEPDGYWLVWGFASEVEGSIPSIGGVAVFAGFGEGDAGVGENETRLGHTDALDGLEAGGGKRECAVASETDIFGCKNDHAASDEFGIFASGNHASEVVEGGVGVGAAHGFDECRDGVIMVVAFFVVAWEFFAGGFDDDFLGDVRRER